MDNQTEFLYSKFLQSHGVSTDTRTIEPDNLFFGLSGPNHHGSAFAAQALEKGASFAVIDDPDYKINNRMLVVPDVLKALQELAAFHRSRYKRVLIGLTGSNGKTTTKELLTRVLSKKYIVHATVGNYNNHIGVPLSLLHIYPQVEIAIIEMGANHQGEIAELCKIAHPTHGLITNIGHAHTETFGGIAGVLKGKTELFDFLTQNKGTIFLNESDTRLRSVAEKYKGYKAYHLDKIQPEASHPYLSFRLEGKQCHTHLTGAYNLENIAAVVEMGRYFGVPDAEILDAIAGYQPENHRSQVLKVGERHLIVDAYNANPDSMKAAIENLAAMPGTKAVILGGMNELDDPEKAHRDVVHLLIQNNIPYAVLIGEYFGAVKEIREGFYYYKTKAEAEHQIKEIWQQADYLLVKASRASKLETLLNWLQ